MKELTIVVSGKRASGKTTISRIIEQALTEKGFKVKLMDPEDSLVKKNLTEATEALKSKLDISILTLNLNRNASEKSECIH